MLMGSIFSKYKKLVRGCVQSENNNHKAKIKRYFEQKREISTFNHHSSHKVRKSKKE